MNLYVLFGIPASGKTTLARQMEKRGCVVHSYDELYAALCGKHNTDEINARWIDSIRLDLLAGRDVVCDGNCTQAHLRAWVLNRVADIPCRKVLIAVVAPVEKCLERNALRKGAARVPQYSIEIAAKHMQPPTDAEGWDEITVYKN